MRRTGLWASRKVTGAQVLGADVPSFENFPYLARDVLYLYRDFCRLIYRHPPQERRDLFFRLRNEFRSKRNLSGSKAVRSALRRGEGILEAQKSLLDTRRTTQSGLAGRRQHGAQCVDNVFDQLRCVAGHVLPGLRNYKSSLPLLSQRYAEGGSTNVVSQVRPSRRRT